MSDNDVLGTPGEGHTRRKPSYSEVLKATPVSRPAPINTDITRAIPGGVPDTSTTASSAFWSTGSAPLATGTTAPQALFSPSIWSPIHQGTRSATVTRKDSWETAMNGKINEVIAAKAASPGGTGGLGVQLGGDKTSPKRDSGDNTNGNPATASSPYKYTQKDIPGAQSKPLFPGAEAHLSKAAPLVQQPFVFPVRTATSTNVNKYAALQSFLSEESTTASFHSGKPNDTRHAVLYITPSEGGSEGDGHAAPGIPITFLEDDASETDCTSEISETGESEERDQRIQAPMIAEEPHPQNFIRTLMDGNIPFSTAFDGADAVCTAINPSHYAMEYGSRAICIKTDFVENIHWAVKHGRWGVMDRVASRIMQLYDKRSGNKDKVLLIFSVNGQKSYCGLAEMSGAWVEDEAKIEGFKIKKEGNSKTWGTMPITWIFIKNVSYYWFRDIKNPQSEQDIANMWNGMHYPADIARQVVERIISRPHFTNVLAWRQDETYDPFRPVLEASQIDPLATDTKKHDNSQRFIESVRPAGNGQARGQNGTRGTQSNRASALALSSWRRPQGRYREDDETTSSATTSSYRYREDAKHSSTPPNLDGHVSPRPKTGELVICRMDRSGNLVPLTPKGSDVHNPMAETPRGISPNPKHQERSTSSRGGFPSFRGGRGGGGRGSFRGVNHAEGTFRVSSSPHLSHKQQPDFVGPQLRRMKSDAGLEDPFGGPQTEAQGNEMPKFVQFSENAHAGANSKYASNGRANISTKFGPQNKCAPATSSNPALQSSNLTVSHENHVSAAHAQGNSGGVMLLPTNSQSPMVDTPSRLPGQGSVKAELSKRDFTPTGHQIYPSPIDQSIAKSPTEHIVEQKGSDKGKLAAVDVAAEYSEYLRRQQVMEAELMSMKFTQAGLPVPENLKTTIAAGAKRP